jgi:hypothetical protein
MKMLKTIVGLMFLPGLMILVSSVVCAQSFTNHWLESSQRYYKITTAEDGIYRLSYEDLSSAGIAINTLNPRNIQIFHRGEEQAIYVRGQNTGVFGVDDYIDFYGRRNDGALDSGLYVTPEAHTNGYHSLFSDSTAYFLTWSLSQPGKRISTFYENNILNLPAEDYELKEIVETFDDEYSIGLHYPLGQARAESYLSAFDHGEGWTGMRIRQGQFKDVQFQGMSQAVFSGPKPILEILLAGRNNLNHNVSIEVGADQASLRTVRTLDFKHHNDTLLVDTLEWSDIGPDEMVCRVRVNDLGKADQVSVTYAKITFASGFDQESSRQMFYHISGSNTNRSYLEFENVPLGSRLFDVSDEINPVEISYNVVGFGINAMIDNNANGRKLLLTSQLIPHTGLKPMNMRNIHPSADFVIITNEYLRQPAGNYEDPVQSYGAYRASEAGGGFDTLIINMDELYDMFSYGDKTPLAIHEFCSYMSGIGAPKYFFIIGKGLTPNYNSFRKDFATQTVKNLVPAAGYPGSDILYTSGLNGSTHEPGVPIGRIAAKTPGEVIAYFEKVKEKESLSQQELWQKELVHLSGGGDARQQSLFKSYVNDFRQLAEDVFLGGQVSTISKQTTGTTELINISEQVNAGKMLITFFGHSGSEITDLDIGNVSNPSYGYNNKGKYPFMLVNGCVAGDMYNSSAGGFGEDWINTPEKGAVGFIAHAGAGISTLLKRYSDLFYEVAFSDTLFIGKSIGEIQKEAGRRYLANYEGERNIAQVQQMALQGDPGLIFFGAEKPDFSVKLEDVFAEPVADQTINVFSDFKLGIIVKNFGISHTDSLQIAISRTMGDGTILQNDTLLVKSVLYMDTIYYDVLARGIPSAGNNFFDIHIDPLDQVDELDKLNNSAVFTQPVLGDLTKNVVPYNYAIINETEITLIAQALDVLGGSRDFRFELDTTAAFDSPYRQSSTVADQVIARWNVNLFENLPGKDTLTFYWRTQYEDQPVDSLKIWNESSFTYINSGVSGWAMNHFAQFRGNALEQVVLNDKTRTWEFEQFETGVQMRTFGDAHPDYDHTNVQLIIEGTEYIFPTKLCTDNSMNFVAFDKSSTIPYLVLGRPNVLDRKSCGRLPQIVNNMLNVEIETSLLIEDYVNSAGDGDFVLAFSIGNVTYESWPPTTLAKLEEIGVDVAKMQVLAAGEPVIVFGRKGMAPGEAAIITADYSSPEPASEQEISLDRVINGQSYQGTITSPRIGPASGWGAFRQSTALSEMPPTDVWAFNIYGIDNSNKEALLVENTQLVYLDIEEINADTYPFLRVEMLLSDQQNLTPPQLQKWFVIYDGVPEGILTYKKGQATDVIEKDEGEVHLATFAFENVSKLAFADSIAVEYGLFNIDLRKAFIDTMNIEAPAAGSSAEFEVLIETNGKVGENDLHVFANPYLLAEQDYNNNSLHFPTYINVAGDNTNPILEVTVDGEFIMDGDIVAPSPLIVLRLKDENKILLKEDTMGVNLYLNRQCENCTSVRVSFSSPNVIWTPASDDEDFKVEYQPDNLEDGIYTLKAEASDASGNASGTEPYSVNFEIVNESQITNFFPYPNPFSTRTHFVFTLTGSEIPDDIIIQIMTVNGTVVREITMDEVGPIKIGHNKTAYAWDGRDEYGDQLANGVYLYQVKIYTNGQEMKHRQTAADKAFKHGFGKMYLLR